MFFSRYTQTRGWSTTLTLIHYNIFTILYLICTIKELFCLSTKHTRCGDILSRVAMERTLETNVINSLILFLVYYINNKLQRKICNLYFLYCPIFLSYVWWLFSLSVNRRQWILHLSFSLQANWWCFKGNCVWL